jgi:predicted 3-demethylubiquinone-9 3-methyltransferase (glyoxalase superfamily)
MANTITPFLWFDHQAEAAANFYISIFPNSRITGIARYGEAGPGALGCIMTVGFELDGQPYTALNGGPHFKFNEAVSFVVHCKSQQEVDHYWDRLVEGGAPSQCGWLKDRYGLSWQIVPDALIRLLQDPDAAKAGRVGRALMKMVKLDIGALQRAYDNG